MIYMHMMDSLMYVNIEYLSFDMIYDLCLANEILHAMNYDDDVVCIHWYLGWTNLLQVEILVDIGEMHSREGILSQ
jgi:hypothetical protein